MNIESVRLVFVPLDSTDKSKVACYAAGLLMHYMRCSEV